MQHISVVVLQIHSAQVRTKRFSVLCKELKSSVVGLILRNCKIRIKNLVMKCCPYIFNVLFSVQKKRDICLQKLILFEIEQ